MKKTTIAIILGMFLISLVSSVNVGETINYDFSNKVDSINSLNYSVINGSNEWFDVSFSDSIVSITPNELLETGDYSIELLINGEKYVVSSGGSSQKYYKWDCSEWSECEDGHMNRTCSKVRVYYKNDLGNKPHESMSCYIEKENKTENIDDNKSNNENCSDNYCPFIPTDIKENKNDIVYIIFFGLIFLCSILFYFLNKKFKRKRKIKNEIQDKFLENMERIE